MTIPSDTIRAAVARLLRQELRAPAHLAHLVEAQLAAARRGDPDVVDHRLAAHTAAACVELLAAWDDLDETGRRHVQAACLYFAESDDEEDDLDSILGFDDDAEAVAWLAALVGRDDVRDRLREAWTT